MHGPLRILVIQSKLPGREGRSTPNARGQLKGAGLKARKGLGQNFLTDMAVRDAILDAAALSVDDTVLEVGPGLGVLTERLVDLCGRVTAVELDTNLAERLQKRLAGRTNFDIVNADILSLDLSGLMRGPGAYKVVANIPYYITSPILRYFTQAVARPSLMVIMMQLEVAADVVSKPGHMGFLAVSMRVFSRPEILCKVPATSFYPAPRVDSAVVKFNMLQDAMIPAAEIKSFLELVHAGFSAPRKQIHNSLSIGLKLDAAGTTGLLDKAGIEPARRPGTLTLDEWMALYRVVEGRGV